MANERYGNNYLVTIGQETAYGIEAADYEVVLPNQIEIQRSIAPIDVSGVKTGVLEKKACEKQAGYISGTATISGGLYLGADASTLHGKLLEAFFHDSSSPFTVPAVGTSPISYTLHRYFNDDKSTKMDGAVCESLELSGSSGGLVALSAKFRGKNVYFENNASTTPENDPFASIPNCRPVLFSDVQIDFGNGLSLSGANNFNLTLSNQYAEDKIIYQNSHTKTQELLTGFSGTFGIEWNYDKINDADVYDFLMSNALIGASIVFSSGGVTWSFSLHGKITEYNNAEPDKGIFTSSASIELMSDDSNSAIEVTTA
jgi:hypothetical protein